ncbi:ABC transporter permease [Herbiconiux sp. CPCC 203407]|uniref:ABC transporter permease n=1 Tax=Herbiconiux oxytropis TaxID=2970915 RepID=A0AA41XIN7_9MICO|nr:ABC transporter permease [Herbiconiux oxytropis]MCS5722237.1 ABC transporter permease [Herbiconiux oxytropis]MCS5727125.1 ABC transporter permease [Herbiconiux oxytropis]
MKKTEAIQTVDPAVADRGPAKKNGVLAALSFRNISAIYIFVVLFAIFAIITPRTFLTPGTWLVLLDAQSITVLAAIAVLIPLVNGVFNLAIGAEVGFAVILVAVLQTKLNMPWGLAIAVAILIGAFIGLVSGLIITKGKIDSFIATLGMSSILLAGLAFLSENRQIIGLQDGFRLFATGGLPLVPDNPNFKLTNPVFIMLIVAFIVWYLLERTPVGRRMYAAGYNPDGARLSGVNVARLQIASLVAGGIIAALAGVLLASRINAGDPTVGPGLLLPALTAVFLGSTQFKGGRFNVWGTVISVYVLAVGIKGLQLLGAQNWVSDLFNGVALLAAVGLSRWERTAKRGSAIKRATPKFGRGK